MSQPLSPLQMGTGLDVAEALLSGAKPVALLQGGSFATRRQSGVVVGVCGRMKPPEAASWVPTTTPAAELLQYIIQILGD